MTADRVSVGLPPRMSLRTNMGSFVLARRWFDSTAIFLALFAAFWDGFLVHDYIVGTEDSGFVIRVLWFEVMPEEASLIYHVIRLGVVVIGVYVSYVAISRWVNRTTIRVADGRLSVRHGPLPWPGNRTMPVSDVKQLYTKERFLRSRKGTEALYDVRVLTAYGGDLKLVSGLTGSEQALYIEQELEKHLSIDDQPVRGGYPP